MKTSDKYLLSLIWGLFFIIVSLPVFAAEQDCRIATMTNHQEKIAQPIAAMILRM